MDAAGADILHMVVEQTPRHPMRMIYHPETGGFIPSEVPSLLAARAVPLLYGWIRESGSPPGPHWDCIFVPRREGEPGDVFEVRVIGLFQRADGDHKYVVTEAGASIDDLSQLSEADRQELFRIYPRVSPGEGWFGQARARFCMARHPKAL